MDVELSITRRRWTEGNTKARLRLDAGLARTSSNRAAVASWDLVTHGPAAAPSPLSPFLPGFAPLSAPRPPLAFPSLRRRPLPSISTMGSRTANRRPLISLQAHLQSLLLTSSLDSTSFGGATDAAVNSGPASTSNGGPSSLVESQQDNLQQLGPIIKSLDEAGRADAFLRLLRDFAREEDERIKRICDENSADFASAVDKLLKVRASTISLRHRIGELNEEVQAGGASLGNKKRQLLESQRTTSKIDEAVETLQLCLRVLNMANRVDGLIEERKYYPALRVSITGGLHDLSSGCVQLCSANTCLSSTLRTTIVSRRARNSSPLPASSSRLRSLPAFLSTLHEISNTTVRHQGDEGVAL